MMEEFFDFILEIDPTVMAAIVAAFVALLSIFLNKQIEISKKQRNIKEEKYIAFLSALVSFRDGFDTNRMLSETLQVIYLIGTSEVVNATKDFVELFDPKIKSEGPTDEEQFLKYSKMLQAMRKDLYGNRINKEYPDQLKTILADNTNQRMNRRIKEYILTQPIHLKAQETTPDNTSTTRDES